MQTIPYCGAHDPLCVTATAEERQLLKRIALFVISRYYAPDAKDLFMDDAELERLVDKGLLRKGESNTRITRSGPTVYALTDWGRFQSGALPKITNATIHKTPGAS